MYIEIEAKLKVDSLKSVDEKLKQLGAEFVAEQEQSDVHFDDAQSTLKNSDRCLRLRKQTVDGKEKLILTYKGPKEQSNLKKRQEIEVEVSNAETITAILQALGYKSAVTVQKRRFLWRLGECEVALDELPCLGSFVEIEGPENEKIFEVQKKLGLADLQHIAKSYACLIAEQ